MQAGKKSSDSLKRSLAELGERPYRNVEPLPHTYLEKTGPKNLTLEFYPLKK